MTDHQPRPLTDKEWAEVAALPAVREAWGLPDADAGRQLAACAFGARFDFSTGGPGYAGDLFVIHDDAFGGPPLVLTRDDGGRLEIAPSLCGHWPMACLSRGEEKDL